MAVAAVVAEATGPLRKEGTEDILRVGSITGRVGVATRVASRPIGGRSSSSVDKGGHVGWVLRGQKGRY